ncbi:hypothetical protein [Actinomadura sediminis]|uniref:Uncharacterized protein n=1 Tax=Actinomadura sediminis TaxID=1038904 RepID=A0ABW3EU44_9ACTN
METTTRAPLPPAVLAALVLLPPPVLAWVLWQVGPEHITVTVNPGLVPLYWTPPALALASMGVAARGAHVRLRRGHPGHRAVTVTAVLGLLMLLPMLLFALACLLCSSIGQVDGGWAPEGPPTGIGA